MILNHSMQHRGLKPYIICINDDTGLTLAYFIERSKLVAYVFEYGKLLQSFLRKKVQQMNKLIENVCFGKQ